jgi:hypothetical protein
MVAEHHYVGPHSDRHLLYAPWGRRDSLLVTKQQFDEDISNNLKELNKFGIKAEDVKYFLPPYEWCNRRICQWSAGRNMQLINFTPGTGTNADYTTPEMSNYKSSEQLTEGLMKYENTKAGKLNGAIILIHLGTHPDRTDKFYNSLDRLIASLSKKGYSFRALNE